MLPDKNMERIVRISQKEFYLRYGYDERGPVKYVKRNLIKPDKQSLLGWRPTPVFLDLMNNRPAHTSKQIHIPFPSLDTLIMDAINETAIGGGRYEIEKWQLNLGYDLLLELGLVWRDPEGNIGATPRLLQLCAKAHYGRFGQ